MHLPNASQECRHFNLLAWATSVYASVMNTLAYQSNYRVARQVRPEPVVAVTTFWNVTSHSSAEPIDLLSFLVYSFLCYLRLD
jgi:hypothetical protein